MSIVFWIGSILFLSYVPGQDEFRKILPGLVAAFGSYFVILKKTNSQHLWLVIGVAVLTRILVIPAFPNLSDDIYRFIWDGRMWHSNLHPYSLTPDQVVGINSQFSKELFFKLNSENYYSIYPPVAQFIFWVCTFLPSMEYWLESVLMKVFHVLFDVGSIFVIIKILDHLKINRTRAFLYALNPLIIIELTSNLHHEGIMIFFVLLGILFIFHNRIVLSGLSFSLAIATKILPVLFIPLVFFWLSKRNRWVFAVSVITGCLILFLPLFYDYTLIQNFNESVSLYFKKFEFNASLYYLGRYIGYLIHGYNIIHIIGPAFSVISVGLILFIALNAKKLKEVEFNIFQLMTLTYLCYAFFSATLHPWYIAILVALCVFTSFRSPLIWSFFIMATYINYSSKPYDENLWVVFIEYAVVISLLFVEIKRMLHNSRALPSKQL